MLHECPTTKDKDRKRHEVMNELLKSLSRAGSSNRRLPPNDLKFGLDALHLDGEELKEKGFDDLKRAGGKLKNVHGLGVAQLLRCAKGLTCVDLSHNDLGPEVAIAIGEALERNDSLTQLYLNVMPRPSIIHVGPPFRSLETPTTRNIYPCSLPRLCRTAIQEERPTRSDSKVRWRWGGRSS